MIGDIKYKQAYRCRYYTDEGIGFRGPFSNEVTIITDDSRHFHVDLHHPDLEIMTEIYVAPEAIPAWVSYTNIKEK